jgi:hypothetical protein
MKKRIWREEPSQDIVIQALEELLKEKGYRVVAKRGGQGIGVDIEATKEDEKFIIEAIGTTKNRRQPRQDICISIGEIVSRMKDDETKTNYGIAMPITYLRYLSGFGVEGLNKLGVHLFLLRGSFEGEFKLSALCHFTPQEMIELMTEIKDKNEINVSILLLKDMYFLKGPQFRFL